MQTGTISLLASLSFAGIVLAIGIEDHEPGVAVLGILAGGLFGLALFFAGKK